MFKIDPSFRACLGGLAPTVGLALLMGAATVASALADAKSPEGIWYTKGQESIIKVHPCTEGSTSFCGTLVWLKEPTEADGSQKIDTKNEDLAKKNKPLVGLDILIGMKPDNDHYKGKAYNPEDGKLYSITFTVKTDKEEDDVADLRGCLGDSWITGHLCQTEVFKRAKDVPGGDPTADAKKHKVKKEAKKDSAHK